MQPSPQAIIVPLNVFKSRYSFKSSYGLNNGINYDMFLELIRTGRIYPILNESPEYYSSEFYQEIFTACQECQEGAYLPAYPDFIFNELLENIMLLSAACEEGIPILGEWYKAVRDKRQELSLEHWRLKILSLITPDRFRSISSEHPYIMDKADLERILVSNAYRLSISGYKDLANLSLSLFKKDPNCGLTCFETYTNYLTDGYSCGLGGFRIYDKTNMKIMSFFGIMEKHKSKTAQDLMDLSPSSFTLVSAPYESLICNKADNEDVKLALKRDFDKEITKISYNIQSSLQNYDFRSFIENANKTNKIVTERLNEETKDIYVNSKFIKAAVRMGGTLAVGLTASAFLPFGISTLASALVINAPKLSLGEHLDNVSRYLSRNFIFKEKGLPCVLWDYNIEPDEIFKGEII